MSAEHVGLPVDTGELDRIEATRQKVRDLVEDALRYGIRDRSYAEYVRDVTNALRREDERIKRERRARS